MIRFGFLTLVILAVSVSTTSGAEDFPSNPQVIRTLYAAQSLEKAGKKVKALEFYTLIVRRYPSSEEAQLAAIRIQDLGGRIPDSQATGLLRSAQNLEKSGKKEGALEFYALTVKRYPSSPEAKLAIVRLRALGGWVPTADEYEAPRNMAAGPSGNFPRPKKPFYEAAALRQKEREYYAALVHSTKDYVDNMMRAANNPLLKDDPDPLGRYLVAFPTGQKVSGPGIKLASGKTVGNKVPRPTYSIRTSSRPGNPFIWSEKEMRDASDRAMWEYGVPITFVKPPFRFQSMEHAIAYSMGMTNSPGNPPYLYPRHTAKIFQEVAKPIPNPLWIYGGK